MTHRVTAADIREARPEDAGVVARLNHILGRRDGEPKIRHTLDRLGLSDADIILVAESNSGEVLGWVHGAERETLGSGRRCEILGLVVGQEARGGGVGRRLVAAVEAWGRQRGLEQILVRSSTLREESHPFYARLGYERSKTQHVYQKRIDAGSAI